MAKKNLLIRKSLYKLRFLPFLAYIVFGLGVPDSSAQFKWGAVASGDTGQSMASDGHGTVVVVAQAPGEVSPGGGAHLWYRVGQYDAAAQTIKWGPKVNYDIGNSPSVAVAYCAAKNQPKEHVPALTCYTGVVEVHIGGGGPISGDTSMWYRVGVINGPSDSPIVWKPKAKSTKYDNGETTSVAISGDASTIVDVHGGAQAPNNSWYKVGKVDWKTGIIKWGKSAKYGTGYWPLVAVSGSTALEVHGPYGTPKRGGLVYHVGQIKSSSLTISGFASPATVYDANADHSSPDVAISSCEFGTGTKGQPAVEVHGEGPAGSYSAFYRLGTFDGNTLTLGPSQPYGTAGTGPGPVAMGSDGVPITDGPKAYYVGTSLCPPPPPIK